MEGRRPGGDEGTTALFLPARLHSLSFLSSFPPLSCFRVCRLLGSDGLLVNPHFTLSLVLAQPCWLMMCSVWQSSLWVLAMGGKPWFPSQALVSRVDWALIIHDGKRHRAAFRLRLRSSSLLDDFPLLFLFSFACLHSRCCFSSCVGRDL